MYAIEINQFNLLAVAGSFVNRAGWIHNGRKLNSNLLMCVEEGECTVQMAEKEYHLQKNDFLVIPQNTFYKPHTESYCKHWFCHFHGNYLGKNDAFDIEKRKSTSYKNVLFLPQNGKADKVLTSALDHIAKKLGSTGNDADFKKTLAFLNILNHLASSFPSGKENLSAQEIQSYIMDNLTGPVTLSSIASHFAYTKQYIIHIFKKNYFVTPTKFIIDKRLELAKIYLAETNLKLYEISSRCGFEDANYFSRLFKMNYRVSPQKYRKDLFLSNT